VRFPPRYAFLAIGVVSAGILMAYVAFFTGPTTSEIDDELVGGYYECLGRLADKPVMMEKTTNKMPNIVQVSWNPYALRTQENTDFRIMILDNETKQPISNATYDFHYKGPRDLGVIEDRTIDDFAFGPDVIPVKINYPCDITAIVFIDMIGDQSFSSENYDGINVSAVSAQFEFKL